MDGILSGMVPSRDPARRTRHIASARTILIVQLPSGWRDYWVSPAGDFVTSGDPGFDPNTPSDPGWQRLRPHGS